MDVLRQAAPLVAQRLTAIDPGKTRAGTVEWKIATRRHGRDLSGFLPPRRIAEKALTAVIQGACVKGICMRSGGHRVEAPGMSGVSWSPVSRLRGERDEQGGRLPGSWFLNGTLEGDGPDLGVDANDVKTREPIWRLEPGALVEVAHLHVSCRGTLARSSP